MKIKYLYDRLNTISESAFFNNFYKVSKGTQYFVDSVTHELRERERESCEFTLSQTNDVMYELLKF